MGLSLCILSVCMPMCLCWHFGVKYLSVCLLPRYVEANFGCCGLAVSPRKPRVPHCEERPGAAHSRRDQIALWVRGVTVRDASAIPCCGAREVARCARWDASAIPYHPGWDLRANFVLQTWLIGVYLAHIKFVSRHGDHHTARSDTPMQNIACSLSFVVRTLCQRSKTCISTCSFL